jgi:N-glycosylase/DNA lyase
MKIALHGFLRMDDDLDAIHHDMATDRPPLAEAAERWRGLRVLRQDPWECLVSFVCSQVSNIRRISRNMEAMARTYGEQIVLDGRILYRFPTVGRLAAAGEDALLALGLGFRAKYVARVASVIAAGGLDLMALRQVSYQEAKTALLELYGVGEKVADCVLVFSLDKLEGFPIDRWVLRALVDWYGHSEKTRYGDQLMWARERWGKRAGYVQQYLYHHRRLMG